MYVKKIKGTFCFKVKGPGGKEGIWVVDAKNGNGSVKFGVDRKFEDSPYLDNDFCKPLKLY